MQLPTLENKQMYAPIKDNQTLGKSHKQSKKLFDCFNNDIEEYKCRHCDLQTHSLATLKQHSNKTQIPRNPVLNCQQCLFQTYSKYLYVRHKKFDKCASKSENDWLSELLKQLRKFRCDVCDYRTVKKVNLDNHILARHTPSNEIFWLRCRSCSYKTKWRGNLKVHTLVRHTPEDQIQWFKCHKCEYKSKLKNRLKNHVIRVHQDFDFLLSDDWKEHIETKKEDQIQFVKTNTLDEPIPVKCTTDQSQELVCEQDSNQVNREHMIKNNITIGKTSWLHCKPCDYRCKSVSSFNTHVTRHHTRWFRCDQCKYKTKNMDHLKDHIKANHDWCECPHCDYRSRQKNRLDVHIFSEHVTDEIPSFSCQYCKFQSRWREALKAHIVENHASEKQSQLFECRNYNFKTKKNGGFKEIAN